MSTDERGFNEYGELRDTKGSRVYVKESSAVGAECCWVFADDNPHWDTPKPHLNAAQARQLAAMLLKFAAHAEQPGGWRNSPEYKEAFGE